MEQFDEQVNAMINASSRKVATGKRKPRLAKKVDREKMLTDNDLKTGDFIEFEVCLLKY